MGHEGIDLPDSVEDLRALVLSKHALIEEQTDRIDFLEEAIRRGYDSRDVYRLLERAYLEAGDEDGVRRVRAHLGNG